MTQRVEPDMTSVWAYDTAAHGIGKPASAGITAGQSAGYQRSFGYDTLGRPVQVGIAFNGPTQIFAATYDAANRLSTVSYPSGFAATYTYTSLGYAQQLTDAATGQVYWTANARDTELHLTQQTAGNGVVTSQGFDAATGRLNTILADAGNIVENFSYTYDVLGNVLIRADTNQNLTETFSYDDLNWRLSTKMESQSPQFAQTHPELDLLTGHGLAKLPGMLVRHGCFSSPPSSARAGSTAAQPVSPTRPRFARPPSPKTGRD